jgi:bacillithiol biosynthesis cysteine-adding enzyme BshC
VSASIFDAYVSGGAREFFPSSFLREGDRLDAVERAGRIAPAVLARLEVQHARFGQSTARTAHLAALAEGAAVVVTGQQAGLFLGPLYTVYKAASAIRWARALAQQSGRPVVPVFWLQTEDHDLAEIAHCTLQRPQAGPLELEVPVDSRNHVSIAHLTLPESIRACHATLERELGALPEARLHLDRLARHYQPGARWSDAFSSVLVELFEPEGLLVIDPRDRVLAAELRAFHREALDRSEELGALLVARRDALERSSYEAVVHVRPDAPLAFFHPEASEGPRYRLAPAGPRLTEIGGTRSHELQALRAALASDPLCFSTSALLRPLAQDTLLPTAAYIGGPAEVAYYAQLAPLYAAFGKELPLVVPRARFRVIEPAAARLLARYSLEPSAAERSEPALLLELAAQRGSGDDAAPSPEAFERELRTGFEAVLAGALAKLPAPAGSMQGAVDKTRRKLETTSRKLAERFASVRAAADESHVRDVRRLRAMLQPDGVPQERSYGLAYYASRFGERAFLERVLREIEPFDAARKELYL